MKVIARIRTPFAEKFGVPRQSSLAPHTRGVVVFEPEFRRAEALRGLEGFDWIWLIWEFSENGSSCRESESKAAGSADDAAGSAVKWQATVRPPRLGGNKRMGVRKYFWHYNERKGVRFGSSASAERRHVCLLHLELFRPFRIFA